LEERRRKGRELETALEGEEEAARAPKD